MKALLIATAFVSLNIFASSTARATPESARAQLLTTTLLPAGDDEIANRFAGFLKTGQSCEAKGSGHRVLLTGFGLFAGVPSNISGLLIANFSRPDLWPESLGTAIAPVLQSQKLESGILSAADSGAHVSNRSLAINGKNYEVCFLELDVLWDLGGAILATEMERFQPELVVMTGAGPMSVLESQAINETEPLNGFNSDGSPDRLDTPENGSPILGTDPSKELVNMTWNNQTIAARLTPAVQSLHLPLLAPQAWSPANDYICNNISFIALKAAAGEELKLAGGKIELKVELKTRASIGFFHLPTDSKVTPENLPGWIGVFANLVDVVFEAR